MLPLPITIYCILAKFSKSRTSFGPFGGHIIKASAEIPLQPPCAPFSTDGCWWLAMNRTKCCLSAANCNFAPLTHWRLPQVHYDALWSTMVCSVQPKVQKQDRAPTCSLRWQQFSVTKHFSALYYMAFITFLMRRIQTPKWNAFADTLKYFIAPICAIYIRSLKSSCSVVINTTEGK